MAASYIYGLAASDVAGELAGIDDAAIGASTTPVNTTNLTTWINDGAARFNAALAKSGIDVGASMDADAHQAIATGVKAYAVHKALLVIGHMGPALDAAEREWLSIFHEYSNQPQQLGDAYVVGLTTATDGVTETNREAYDGFFRADGSEIKW